MHVPGNVRVWIEYERQLVELPQGESTAGRGIDCRVRFNDPTVSRDHLRIVVERDRALAEDLGSSNGTWINDQPLLRSQRQLADGDLLQIGQRRMRVRIGLPEATEGEEDTLSVTDPTAVAMGAGRTTAPSDDLWWTDLKPGTVRRETPTPPNALPVVQFDEPVSIDEYRIVTVRLQHCPRCRTPVSFNDTVCPTCSHRWPREHPNAPTQPLQAVDQDRRQQQRWRVDLPVLYASSELTFHGAVRDLSRGGVYIASDLLDPEGTPCKVDLLPEGQPVMPFDGLVRHVVADAAGQGGRPPGMGVRFTSMSEASARWLNQFLSALEATT